VLAKVLLWNLSCIVLTCAANSLERTLPPNFAFIAPNVDSTLLRRW
jgi:hypothetical protein